MARCVRCSKVGALRDCCGEPLALCRACNDDHRRAVHGEHAPGIQRSDALTLRAEVNADPPASADELDGLELIASVNGRRITITLRGTPR
jgi:hypothetical protein